MNKTSTLICIIALLTVGTLQAAPATVVEATLQDDEYASAHQVGRLNVPVRSLGGLFSTYIQGADIDYFTGRSLLSDQFPSGTARSYLINAGFLVARISDDDTAMSSTVSPLHYRSDFTAVHSPLDYRSTIDPDPSRRVDAISEWDLTLTAADTIPIEAHWYYSPIGIELHQETYSWSLPNVRDIVFAVFTATNMTNEPIDTVALGMYMSSRVTGGLSSDFGAFPDLCGLRHISHNDGSMTSDSLSMVWIADEDGRMQPLENPVDTLVAPDALAFLSLNQPNQQPLRMNWYCYQWGAYDDDFSPTHITDAYIMPDSVTYNLSPAEQRHVWLVSKAHPDMDLAYYPKVVAEDPNWLDPGIPLDSLYYAPEVFASFGPLSLAPGETVTWVTAFIGGEQFHSDPDNFQRNMKDVYDPDAFYAGLSFSDLDRKARIAAKVYDNPGVDTDSDGYAGEYIMDGDDTVWIAGDGIPDWNPAFAPAAPEAVRVTYSSDSAIIRFNGRAVETSLDRIAEANLFEGYTVYSGDSPETVAPVATFDRENYIRYDFESVGGWFPHYQTFTLEELRCTYGESCDDSAFNPLGYTPSRPLLLLGEEADSLIYFERFGYNQPLSTAGLHKVYPDQPYPTSLDPNQANPDELTDDGLLKYFEYEYVVTDLAPGDTTFVDIRSFGAAPAAAWWASKASNTSPLMLNDPDACCVGMRGDLDGADGDQPTSADLAFLVDLLFAGGELAGCDAEADVNGDGTPGNVTDISFLVDFLFLGGELPPACP